MSPLLFLMKAQKAMSADGNHLVAIIKESEDYDKLAKSMADIRNDVETETFKHVSVGTECFEIYFHRFPWTML